MLFPDIFVFCCINLCNWAFYIYCLWACNGIRCVVFVVTKNKVLFIKFLVHIVLDVNGILLQISFFIMAVNWSKLSKECDKIDIYMKSYGFPKYLKIKLYVTCVVLAIFSLGEFWTVIFNISTLMSIDFSVLHSFWCSHLK